MSIFTSILLGTLRSLQHYQPQWLLRTDEASLETSYFTNLYRHYTRERERTHCCQKDRAWRACSCLLRHSHVFSSSTKGSPPSRLFSSCFWGTRHSRDFSYSPSLLCRLWPCAKWRSLFFSWVQLRNGKLPLLQWNSVPFKSQTSHIEGRRTAVEL